MISEKHINTEREKRKLKQNVVYEIGLFQEKTMKNMHTNLEKQKYQTKSTHQGTHLARSTSSERVGNNNNESLEKISLKQSPIKYETNPFVLSSNSKIKTIQISAKSHFINAKVSILTKTEEICFNAKIILIFMKMVLEPTLY